jgi:transcription elongation factor GreA
MQYISQEGLDEHKKELEELKLKRQEIALRLEEAKALGDLAENVEYSAAKEAQAFNEGKIVELEQLLREAVVIEGNNKKSNIVQIGCTIEVKANGKNKFFTIVGSEEADPANGKISNESPLGSAFLGHKEGETVEVETPAGKANYKIVDIN